MIQIDRLELWDEVYFFGRYFTVCEDVEWYYLLGWELIFNPLWLKSKEEVRGLFLNTIWYWDSVGIFPYVKTLEDLTKIYVELKGLEGIDLVYLGDTIDTIEFIYRTSLENNYNYSTYKDYNKYTYFISQEDRFTYEDRVLYEWIPCVVLTSKQRDGTYQIQDLISRYVSRRKEQNITFNNRTMKKNLNWIDITIEYDNSRILVEADWYSSFRADYYWEPEEFYEENKALVYKWFEKQIEEKADKTLEKLKDRLKSTKRELKRLVLPRTKEVLLAKTIDIIREGVADIAELYEEPSIKKQILNLFNKDK